MKVLITGGTGFIGSTIASACADAGMDVVVVGRHLESSQRDSVVFRAGDLGDPVGLHRVLIEHPDIDAVIHCAAKTSIPGSVDDPLGCYEANVSHTIRLLRQLAEAGIVRVLLSSSAAVYAAPPSGAALDEESPVEASSPYASSKLMCERILRDAAHAGSFRALALRYANPIGADPLLRSGPRITAPRTVLGAALEAGSQRKPFVIAGACWPTRDGSALRDYVHVWDVAMAHVAAIDRIDAITTEDAPFRILNIGSGQGVTVRELVAAVERVTGQKLIIVEDDARQGDRACAVLDIARAANALGWRALLTLEDGIRDTIAWSALAHRER